jgi:hypothetical protein
MKKIGLIFCTNHLKYISLWKKDIFRQVVPVNHITSWRHKFVQYLLRSYSNDEWRMHSHKSVEEFEKDLYNCSEYASLNEVESVDIDNFELIIDIKNKVWKYAAIPLSYTDLLSLKTYVDLPKEAIQNAVKSLTFDSSYYNRMESFYKMNEVAGYNIRIAMQVSGHLRFYDRLYNSLAQFTQIAPTDIFMFIWNDSVGQRYRLFDEVDITKKIERCIDMYVPTKVVIESNDDFLFGNVWSGGFKVMETDYCSYPTIKSQYYTIYKCNQLRSQYEQEIGIKYDIVMKMRFDGEFDQDIEQNSLIKLYFKTNFSDVIFVSNERDHSHTGGYTACYLCSKAYWDFNYIHKHHGEHYNDICDFIAISSSDIMNYYCSLYNNLEELYTSLNPSMSDVMLFHENNNRLEVNKQNTALLPKYNSLYQHSIITPDLKEEYRITSETPWYPEAILRVFLRDYMVVSNRYFRIKLVEK